MQSRRLVRARWISVLGALLSASVAIQFGVTSSAWASSERHELPSTAIASAGRDATGPSGTVEPTIIGGSVATIADAPWQVALINPAASDEWNGQFCGGSLIDAQWVLTAAHCVVDQSGVTPASQLRILAGQATLSQSVNNRAVSVSQIIAHPDYDPAANHDDIALVRLASSLTIVPGSIETITLTDAFSVEGDVARITGWGNTSTTTSSYPTQLRKANVSVVDDNDDSCYFAYPGYDADRMLCATGPSFSIDTCQGDSGGPLAVNDNGVWRLTGITSFGTGCAQEGYSGVYTEVFFYSAWVAELMLSRGNLTTATPTISGTPTVGSTLTGNPGTWGPEPVELTYAWRRGTTVVGNAQTYVVTLADVGQGITFRVTGSKPGYTSATTTSVAVTGQGSWTATPTPTISGNLVSGQTLTANEGTWQPMPTSFTYRWKRNGVNIAGATAKTYVLQADDVGVPISVTVTGVKANYPASPQTSNATANISPAPFTSAPVPTISGTVRVGQTLTAVPGTWSPATTSMDYSWSISSSASGVFTPIEGATSATYALTAADLGKFVKVTVTGKRSGNADTVRTSVATVAVVAGTFVTPPVPTITGTLRVGETLTAGEGAWSPVVDSYTYVWSSAATSSGTYAPISGATGKTYVLQAADRGRFVKVSVTGVKAGFTSATSTSVASAVVVASFTTAPTPTIAGTPQVGRTLTATPGSWSPSATLTYQWRRTVGGVTTNISGATAATYVLVAADRGAVVSVAVRGAAATYETTTRVSADTAVVDFGVFTSSPIPTITGSPVSGQTLTAVPGSWSPTATFTYRWFAGTDLVGTAVTLPVTAAMVGKQITVEVTGAANGYTSVVRTSAATVAVTLPLIASAPTPTISGTVKVGNTLTAAPGTLSGSTVKSYQWSWSATSTGTYAAIPGATGNTYVIDGTYATRFLKVTVTWQKSGNADTPKTSNATTAVAAGTFATPPVPTIAGTRAVGQTLTANPGTWTPTPDSYTYTWFRANTATGTYTAISGATGATYQLQAADLGKFLKVRVTGIKTGYTNRNSSQSAATTAITN